MTHKKPRQQALSLLGSWVAAAGTQDAPSAYRTTDGMVILDGATASGTITANTKIATLPTGVRPAHRVRFNADNGGANVADIHIDPSGDVFLATAAPSNALLSLTGLLFPAA